MEKRIELKSLKAELTVGLNRSYSDEKISTQEFVNTLTDCQRNLERELNVKLSAKVTPCRIVFSGQNEESVSVSFINYPKFPVSEAELKMGVEYIARELMELLSQNRVVIEYADFTLMLEQSTDIDPKII